MIQIPRTWKVWAKGLVAAFIGGGASVGSQWTGRSVAHAVGLQVSEMTFNDLWVMFLSAGVVTMLAYLKDSPVPRDAWTDEQRAEAKK